MGGVIGKGHGVPRKVKNLYQRDGIWWGRIVIAGQHHRASLRTADVREAKVRLDAWRQKLERKAIGVEEDHTFQEAVVRWIDTILPGAVKPSVATRYVTSIKQLRATFGSLRMSEITTRTISDYLASRAGKVSNATLNRDLTALSRLLSACVAWGWRYDNPAKLYDRSLIRERREPIQPPTAAQLEAVLRVAPPEMQAVLRLLDATGMRENEAVTLDRANVDFEQQRIVLTRTKTNRPRALNWQTPGGDAGAVLNHYRDRIGSLFVSRLGETYRNFPTFFGKVMRNAVAAEKKAKRTLRPFRVHDLRHGFAIRWLKQGGDLYRLQKHLGHSSVKTTERYLAYLTVEEQEALGATLVTISVTGGENQNRNEANK